jgi:Zn-dependent peptidase ImmA (M78 family)
MIVDFCAPPQSLVNIEQKSLAWRHALGVHDTWAPDIARLIETKLPRLIPAFALVVRTDDEMSALDNAEAYTEFDPPKIAVSERVYRLACQHDGRARMTFAHELGHLVMPPGAAKPRIASGNKTDQNIRIYQSAEWQARKFAAYFLLPRNIATLFSSVQDLAENCRASFQAAEIRFKELGLPAQPIPDCAKELAKKIEAASSKPRHPEVRAPGAPRRMRATLPRPSPFEARYARASG